MRKQGIKLIVQFK